MMKQAIIILFVCVPFLLGSCSKKSGGSRGRGPEGEIYRLGLAKCEASKAADLNKLLDLTHPKLRKSIESNMYGTAREWVEGEMRDNPDVYCKVGRTYETACGESLKKNLAEIGIVPEKCGVIEEHFKNVKSKDEAMQEISVFYVEGKWSLSGI